MRLQRIKSVRCLGGHRLELVFADDYVGNIDLEPLVAHPNGPLEKELQDPALFSRVECDGYTAVWPNDYDLCPDALRYWCELGRVSTQQEVDHYFTEILGRTPSAMLLKDELPKS